MSEAEKQPHGPAPSEVQVCLTDGMERRRFVKWIVGSLLALIGGVFTWSSVSALASRILAPAPLRYYRVDGFDSIPVGRPAKLTFQYVRLDAYLRQPVIEYVWVAKRSAADAVVYSPLCPHLGCRYDWHGDVGQFICPCHNSVFDATGKVLGGPSPRPLDTLASKVENGVLYVGWEYFRAGIPGKVAT
jgi:menaquinol-cytochrome c reductase iron-sulfur subunit